MTRAVSLIAASLLFQATAVALSPPPPLLPPAGWQKHVTPSFEPSIESVLVDSARGLADPKAVESAWQKWGAAATEPLFKLIEDPRWKDYRFQAMGILTRSPFPETHKAVETRIRQGLEGDSASEQRTFSRNLLYHYAANARDAAYPFVVELSKSSDSDAAATAISTLTNYRTPEALAAAQKAIGRLPADKQVAFEQAMSHAKGYLRANEPMGRILESQSKPHKKKER